MSRHHLFLVALGILAAVTLWTTPAVAQNDFYALYNPFRYHQIGYSPRSAAMGGAYSALQDAENGLVGNPASLGFQEKPFISGGFDFEDVSSDLTLLNPNTPVEGEAEIWNVNFGGLYPFEWGAVGLQYGYRWDDLDSGASLSGGNYYVQTGDLDRHYGGLGVGYKMMDGLALGYRFGYFDYELDRAWNMVRPGVPSNFANFEDEFQGHRHQVGVQYQAHPQVVLGLDGYFAFGERDTTISNALGVVGLSDSDADSYAIRGGIAWKVMEDIPLLLAMDINYELRELDGGGNDEEEDLLGIHLGAEYEVYENLFLRTGYQFQDIDFDVNPNIISESLTIGGYSAGIGYKYQNINFDYAFMYIDTGSGDTAHYFGIGYEF